MFLATTSVGRDRSAIAVLAALDSDLNALKKESEIVGSPFEFDGRPIYQARFEGRAILLAKTGATPEAARGMVQWLVREREVSGVVSIGPAGSLSEELLVGDIMVPRNAIRDEAGHGNAPWPLQQVKDCGVKAGNTIVTVKAFVANSSERARLSETYHADLVDMSAAEIADVCASRHIPCAIIREISDLADEEAPRSFVGTSRRQQPRMVQAALCAVRQLGVDKVADEHK